MNFLMTFLGWFGWNWFEFTQAKDAHDDKNLKFNIHEYMFKKWDNWAWSLICAVSLYIIGHNQLGLEFVKTFDEDWKWSDVYYFGSGFFSEVISYSYRRWIKKKDLTDK